MVQALIAEVENACHRTMALPRDFEWLSQQVATRTSRNISPTTLKRLWGYLTTDSRPSLFTLNTLAQFVGLQDYAHFCQHDDEAQSSLVLSNKVTSDELPAGARLKLTWRPDRMCIVRHLGNGMFVVDEAHNTKLLAGDTFTCHIFINQERLYLNDLVHQGEHYACYVAGKSDGVQFEVLP